MSGSMAPPGPDYLEFRTWLVRNPALARELLEKLTEASIGYLRIRVEAGAQAIQIFGSWAGIHPERGYAAFGVPYAARVLDAATGSTAGHGLMA